MQPRNVLTGMVRSVALGEQTQCVGRIPSSYTTIVRVDTTARTAQIATRTAAATQMHCRAIQDQSAAWRAVPMRFHSPTLNEGGKLAWGSRVAPSSANPGGHGGGIRIPSRPQSAARCGASIETDIPSLVDVVAIVCNPLGWCIPRVAPHTGAVRSRRTSQEPLPGALAESITKRPKDRQIDPKIDPNGRVCVPLVSLRFTSYPVRTRHRCSDLAVPMSCSPPLSSARSNFWRYPRFWHGGALRVSDCPG